MLSADEIKGFIMSKQTLRLLVLDLDCCAYLGANSSREDGLNQSLIDKSPSYDAVVLFLFDPGVH